MTSVVDRFISSDEPGGLAPSRRSRWLMAAMELSVCLMVAVAPWCFGSVEPIAILGLYIGLTLIAVLYCLRMVLEGRLFGQGCPLVVCLALILLLGVWQIVPLSKNSLATLSPQTAVIYDRLLPETAEVLPLDQELDVIHPPPGTTISLNPHASRMGLAKLLAVLLLFVFVRNGFASTTSLRRLSMLACVNGMLLSLFALIQFFTSPPGQIYWSIDTETAPFGPFVCRNHFPFYINTCLALGFGWLCSSMGWQTSRLDGKPLRNGAPPVGAFAQRRGKGRPIGSQQPAGSLAGWLWIGLCLSLMMAAVALSMSRGGLLTLLAVGFLAALMLQARSKQMVAWLSVGIIAAAGAALVAWMGSEQLQSRVDTIWSGQAVENRLPLWSRTIALVRDFPVWGTGLGTFEVVEPLTRRQASDGGVLYDHAHNEYIEAAVEGGVVRLALMLAGIALALRMGWRAVVRDKRASSGLALGALLALVAVVIHSIGEFGVHTPAITILVTVVAAHISALAGTPSAERTMTQAAADTSGQPAGYWLLGITSLLFVALPMILCWQGWWAHIASVHSMAVGPATYDSAEEEKLAQIELLQTAVEAAPTNAVLQHELGERRLALYEQRLLAASEGESSGQAPSDESISEELLLGQLVPALRHFVRGRDLCPLLPELQFALAANADRFAQSDSPANYLRRVQTLAPADPRLWYLIGQQQLLDGLPEKAWQSWHRSLQLADWHLGEIVDLASEHLTPEQLRDQLLPNQPQLLLGAARHPRFSAPAGSEPDPATSAARSMFLQAAWQSLESIHPTARAADHHWLAGEIHWESGRPEKAIEAYREAVKRQPAQLTWRLQLAQALYDTQRLEDARRETRLILSRDPRHTQARNLLDKIDQLEASSKP